MADDNAASGGLLVILGIIVALGAVYFFFNYAGHDKTDISIHAEAPKVQ